MDRLVRSAGRGIAFLTSLVLAAPADAKAAAKDSDDRSTRPADRSSVLPLFDGIGLPSVATLQWVQVDQQGQAWKVSGPPRLQVFTVGLEVLNPVGNPKVETASFERFTEELLAKEVPAKDDLGRLWQAMGGGMPQYAELALVAHWTQERGREELSARLFERAEVAFATARAVEVKRMPRSPFPDSLKDAVTGSLAENLRWQAIKAAHDGAPWADLIDRWKVLAETLPAHHWTLEARKMVSAYQAYGAERGAPQAPPADPVEAKVEALRDLAATQSGYPGEVEVLGESAHQRERLPNPADELVAMGAAAIPTVLTHLTDERPTRSMGAWRLYAPGSFYLLTVGDVCQQVFEAITHHPIYRRSSTAGCMSRDGKAAEAQEKARSWWAHAQDGGLWR